MRAVTWHGRADVRVDTVPDPVIQEPTDVIIEVTSTGICGSDLHLIEVMAPFMTVGDVMGHEPMGIVAEVGSEVDRAEGRRPRRRPLQHLVRHLLDVLAGPAVAVRDHAEPRPGLRRLAVRLHEALRPGARRPGGVPPRPVRQHPADQGARGPRGRPVRLPLRRAADGVAGRAVRRHPAGRQRARARARPDRRHGHPDRAAAGRGSGLRRRRRSRAARAGARAWDHGHRHDRPEGRRRPRAGR